MSARPTGTVTFLFTDIEGSTRLAREHPDALPAALARHHAILQRAIDENQGCVFQIVGDAFCAAFHHASDALTAALAAQHVLQNPAPASQAPVRKSARSGSAPELKAQANSNRNTAPEAELVIRVRMGIHSGDAEFRDGAYHGYLTLSRAQRLMSAASGGQVLVSAVSEGLMRGHLREGVTLRDLGAIVLKDFPEPEQVYQVVVPGLPAEFPALKSARGIPNNLPLQLTSFIGREQEVGEVGQLLKMTRLLTLTGSGGTGKTRLSLAVAGEVLDQFADGAWFVELAPLADPALVPQTVATALGLREEANRPILESLTNHLRDKTLLLILDNCEHLVAACASLADTLLHAAPRLTVLASSREALAIAGETAYHVPSLEIPLRKSAEAQANFKAQGPSPKSQDPNPKSQIPIEELRRYAAVRLFVERAAAAKASFALNEANAQAVTQICTQLDGIPLAIELAAARIKVFTPEQIAARVDDRFRLLTGGSRTALPRQQTLRGAIDWSYDLLAEPERILLRRLSVFAGGWTFESAEAVCSSEPSVVSSQTKPGRRETNLTTDYWLLTTVDILDLLARLVEKSLVLLDEQSAEPRYRMLETVRQYAREKLLEAGEAEAVRGRHLKYFVSLAELFDANFSGRAEADWLERLNGELDNVRSALECSLSQKNPTPGLVLVASLYFLWYLHHPSEGVDWTQAMLSQSESAPDLAVRAYALCRAGQLRTVQGIHTEAQRLLEEGRAIAEEINDERLRALLQYALALLAEIRYDNVSARALFIESLFVFRRMNNRSQISMTLRSLGKIAYAQGDLVQAEAYYAEDANYMRQMGGKHGLAHVDRLRGFIALRQGRYADAHDLFKESLDLNREVADKRGIAACIAAEAALAAVRGRMPDAVRLCSVVDGMLEAMHTRLLDFDDKLYEQQLSALRAALAPAAFDAAWAEGRALTLEQAVALALEDSGG